jgi:CRISPR-associated endonuclease/helicase Cas3
MDAYRACSQVVSSETVYHSRFRYIDRVKRHRAVISQFGIEGTAAIAWTSQVAEMSLDLSATLLITDLAPIPALIQRLGRLNRKAKPPNASIMPFIVIEPIDNEGGLQSLPYNQQQLEEALDWLNKLPAEITQRDLVQIWEGMGFKTKEEIPKDSKWIDGGYEREVKEVRSGSPSVNVILRSDVDRVRSGELSLPEVIIPMNQKTGMKIDEWPQFQGATIVNESILQYSELLGGEWI